MKQETGASTYLYFDSNGQQSTLSCARQQRHVAEHGDEEAEAVGPLGRVHFGRRSTRCSCGGLEELTSYGQE